MQNKRALGLVVLVAGIALLIVAVGADIIGVGQANAFGFKQIAGAVGGAFVALVGVFLILQKQAT